MLTSDFIVAVYKTFSAVVGWQPGLAGSNLMASHDPLVVTMVKIENNETPDSWMTKKHVWCKYDISYVYIYLCFVCVCVCVCEGSR